MVTSDCVTITDVRSLRKSLGVDVSAGGSYMGLSASAKVSYVDDYDFSSYSTYVLIRVSVRNAYESVDSPVFAEGAAELITNNKPDRFRQRFGDCFICGVQKGGEYFAIYQISGSNQSEREKISVDVHAAYNQVIASAELNVNIRKETERSHSHLSVSLHVLRQGSVRPTDLTLEDVMNTAHEFPLSVAGNMAYAYTVLLADYSALENPNDGYNFYDTQHQQDVLADLAKRRLEFFALRNDTSYILRNIDDFINEDGTPANRDTLTQTLGEVVQALNAIDTGASKCARDAIECMFEPFEIGIYSLPKLKPGVILLPNFVGMTIAKIKETHIPFDEWVRSGVNDIYGGTELSSLYGTFALASSPESQGSFHSDDEIVATNQNPAAHTNLAEGEKVKIAFELAPGVHF